jgi:uncharacterized membrane protein YozB (DUF420 family)/cytochrome oxidase Cu insertion factor (SCO1/SenC/PrrC family)
MRRAALLLIALCAAGCGRGPSADDLGPLPDFRLTERGGHTVAKDDLKGKVWVASFVFTRCQGGCPQVTATMARLQHDLPDRPDLRLVTFTVDPTRDDPGELARYAEKYHADPRRWLFLTGKPEEIDRLVNEGFRVFAKPAEGERRKPGFEVEHDNRLVLIDQAGHLRGYYPALPGTLGEDPTAEFEAGLRRLKVQVLTLVREDPLIPAINAGLNALCCLLLIAGWVAVRCRALKLHAACMLTALTVSVVFLASYLYYHLVVKAGVATRFQDQAPGAPDWMRYVYFGILGSHTILAIVVAPMALITTYLGLRDRLKGHVALALWTLPLWLYVSVTGVVVYWMLYRLHAPA